MTSSSSPSFSPEPDPEPVFTNFPLLPPEIRHQIWQAAVPVPGINFFNIHTFPNDHESSNRSTSPPWLYLDLRRLSINHKDDAVAEYDPSAWCARETLRRVCREAREVCTLPDSEAATITLTRPRRGLFITAGDGQIKRLTPLTPIDAEFIEAFPLVCRKIRVRADDVLCLSVENCSFNLPVEEMEDGCSDTSSYYEENGGEDYVNDVLDSAGWTYDPELTPPIPTAIPLSRLCISMARGGRVALSAVRTFLGEMLAYCQDRDSDKVLDKLPLIMLDAYKQELGNRRVEELTACSEVLWDRFGDRYVALPWDSNDLPAEYRITKVWPENNDVRERYLQSALLKSPKRPVSWMA
ncbi:hypothetical protein M426DRAFT_321390 [Hypoxylon sp. CI-4A]|nr:hypothetical protein M426DRAFT_321390 [Hypoxylon sp. CI-4A]